MSWININEKLPEVDVEVQALVKGEIIPFVVRYLDKKYFLDNYEEENYMEEGWYLSSSYPFLNDDPVSVTHWQPLPSPPDTPAPLTYTPAQVIEMVQVAWEKGVEWGAQDYWMPEYDETPIRRLLTTLGLSVPGDKM